MSATLAQELADTAGGVFGTPDGRTWVRLRTLSREQYAENGGTEESVHPVFVTVLKAVVPDGQALEEEVVALTHAVAKVCGRPAKNVHVLYLPQATGRMSFGGRIVNS